MTHFNDVSDNFAPLKVRRRLNSATESIALVANRNGAGVVLEFSGSGIEEEVNAVGSRLDDLGLDDAPDGISIWEGHLSVSKPDYFSGEVDTELVGVFRELTEEEWVRLRLTGTPWAFASLFENSP